MNGGWISMNSAVGGRRGGGGGSVTSRVGAVALAIPAYPCASAGRGKQEWGGGGEGKTVMSFFGSWNGRRDWMYK